uniref:SHSP domain-containing protein n=1 Tax=Physcomitrium patens TaxID=3218 RepID=A0A7I4A823_PHYPA
MVEDGDLVIKSEHNAQAQEDGSYNTHVTLPDNAKYKMMTQ